jgi:hypothetical protein
VPILPEGTTLAEKRYATLILRLVLDKQGRLLYGELVDVEDGHPAHFSGWRGLINAVRVWLTRQG